MKNIFVPEVTRLASEQRVDDAIAFAQDAVRDHPGNAEAHSALAHALLLGNLMEQAGGAASQAVALADNEPAFHLLLARIKYMLAQFGEATRHASRACGLSGQLGSTYYQQSAALLAAAAFARSGDSEKAREFLSAAGDTYFVHAGTRITRRLVEAMLTSDPRFGSPAPLT